MFFSQASLASCSSNLSPTNTESLGTTRDNFEGKSVKELRYVAYAPRALQSMLDICMDLLEKHNIVSIAIVHRMGVVPIGEESILIGISSPFRREAWEAGEEALELVKRKVEIWKREEFEDGGVWKANQDAHPGEADRNSHPPQAEEPNRPSLNPAEA